MLDGRAIDVRPVATDLFQARPFATHVSQCVTGVTTVAFGADGRVLSRKPSPAPVLPMLGEWQAFVTFGKQVTPRQRTDLLVALERRSAQLYQAKGRDYRLFVVMTEQWLAVKAQLETARREGLIEFTVKRSPDITEGPATTRKHG